MSYRNPSHSLLDIAAAFPTDVVAVRIEARLTTGKTHRVLARVETANMRDVWTLHSTIRTGVQGWRNMLLPALVAWCRSKGIGVDVREVAYQPGGES